MSPFRSLVLAVKGLELVLRWRLDGTFWWDVDDLRVWLSWAGGGEGWGEGWK